VENGLLEIHRQLCANFVEQDGILVVHDYGDVNAEVHAATNESGIIDLADYAVLSVAGAERIAILERALKKDLRVLAFGAGRSESILDSQANLVATVIVLAKENGFWIYGDASSLKKIGAQLFDSSEGLVSWVNEREPFAVLSVQGAFAAESLGRSIGRAIALGEYHWGTMQFFDAEVTIVKHARTGVDGYDILVPREHAGILWEILISNHAHPFGYKAMNQAHLEAGLASQE
jgi:aminomethyltransferase